MASRTSLNLGLFDGPGEMRALCRDFDWSATPLGPVDAWSHALRTTVSTLLASRHPMFLFWGPDGVQFYNDAYRPSLAGGGRHPRALGMRGRDFWVEIWDIIGPQIDAVMAGGEATWHEDQLVPIERNGRIEEVYWTYSYSPVRDDDGTIGACLVVCQETTERVLAARRLDTLHRLAALPQQGTFDATIQAACRVLASNHADVRFAHCTLGTAGEGNGRGPVAVVPLEHPPSGRVFGTLTVGLSEQLPFETNYEEFVRTAGRDIAGQLLQVESADAHERLLSASERAFAALAESEERYRLAAETARLGTWTWDVVADRLSFDARVADIFALDAGMVSSGAIIAGRVHPDDQETVVTALRAALDPAGTGRYEAEYRVVRPDGTEREVVTAGRAFFIGGAGAQRPTHVIGTVLDVTLERSTKREQGRLLRESENARAALVASEARFRTVQDASPDASLLARAMRDESGRIVDFLFTYANAASRDILVGSEEHVVNRTMRDAFPESVMAGRLGTYAHVVESGVPWQADVEYTRGNVRRGLRVAAVKVGDGVHISAVDLTERLRVAAERERLLAIAENARAEAERARIAAEEANRAKAEFLATMSHELRTPLNAIGGYAELIELGIHGPVTDAQREALARIQASQRHLLGLINDVLNYTRVEAGAVRYDIERAPVMEALIACEALTAPQMRSKQLDFHQAQADPTLAVTADREKLRQILLNLLSNATKFTDAGGSISARVRADGAMVTIEVEDTGRGIPTDQLERIFEPFVQVDARFTRTEQGVGLGLAISRDLARGMGGDLVATSTVGVGSTFRLSLPRG